MKDLILGILFVCGCIASAMYGIVWLVVYLAVIFGIGIAWVLLAPIDDHIVDDELLDEENRIIDLLNGEPLKMMIFSLIPSDRPGLTARAITDMVREGIVAIVYSGAMYAIRYIEED